MAEERTEWTLGAPGETGGHGRDEALPGRHDGAPAREHHEIRNDGAHPLVTIDVYAPPAY